MSQRQEPGTGTGPGPTTPRQSTASPHTSPFKPEALSRRSFLKGAGGVAAAGGALTRGLQAEAAQDAAVQEAIPSLRGSIEIELSINDAARKLKVEPRTTLLSALRHHTEPPLTGTKEVCDRGNCGACTVLVDGRPAYACLLLACTLQGKSITTVEGLGEPGNLSPVQQAFCDKDGLMCGFCTPGFVVATTACLEWNPSADRETVQRELSGNLCRCGTYPHIFDAAEQAKAALGRKK